MIKIYVRNKVCFCILNISSNQIQKLHVVCKLIPISTKRTTTSKLKSMNIKNANTYGVENPGPSLRQAHEYGILALPLLDLQQQY